MKKITKIAIAALLMVACMPGAAQNNVGVLKAPGSNVTATIKGDKDSKFVLNKEGNMLTQVRNQAPKVNEGEMVTLTCNLVPAKEGMRAQSVNIISTTDPSNFITYEWDNFITQVPAGTYDMVALFWDTNIPYVVVKENVTLSNSTTITFDANEAQIEINNFRAVNPNGEPFTLDEYIYDEEWNLIDYIEGNVNYVYEYIDLIRKSDLNEALSIMSYGIRPYYINQLSNRFALASDRIYVKENEDPCLYFVKFFINGDDKLIENNPNDYFYHEEEFVSSKVGESSVKSTGAAFDATFNGKWVFGGSVSLDAGSDIVKFWVNAPIEDQSKAERIDMFVSPVMNDNQLLTIYNFDDGMGNIIFSDTVRSWEMIQAPDILIEDGVKKYNYYGPNMGAGISSFYLNETDGQHLKPIYPGNSTFSFTDEEKIGKFGDNTPINMFAQLEEQVGDDILSYFVCCSMGRYGEFRQVDASHSNVALTVNGEQITTINGEELTYSNMSNYFSPWMNPDREKGLTVLSFDNQNTIVDGLQGRNLTTITFDETMEDHYAPTMTMLQMRDGNGSVTDRFETAQDGKVTFSCGDFKQQSNGFTHWFECERPDVEVSVAPYGQDEWQALNFTEDTEAYAPIAFGHVFNADITSLYSDGWYDLKFKLTDAAGNWQEQIVSPAFLIGNALPTGIEVVKSENATEVARYTIDGRAISAPQAGVNIVKMSDGTVKKVLVK